MAIWQVDIEKAVLATGSAEYWTNVYHVDAASQAAAEALGLAIVLLEKAVHLTTTTFTRMRVQETAPAAPSGHITPLTGTGAGPISGYPLPLFDVVRVDFFPASGRPSRKYLRGALQSTGVDANGLTSAQRTAIVGGYLTPLLATAGFCDPQGQTFSTGQVFQPVGMRQLRRARRKRGTPVL